MAGSSTMDSGPGAQIGAAPGEVRRFRRWLSIALRRRRGQGPRLERSTQPGARAL